MYGGVGVWEFGRGFFPPHSHTPTLPYIPHHYNRSQQPMIPRVRPVFLRTILSPLLLAGFLLLSGCDDTFIDPFDNNDRFYTIYGYLDVLETEHRVRVIPITRFPERIESPTDDQATIDAVVTSTDLNTGQTLHWQHSLDQLDDGTYAHIFRTSFLVQPGHRYRLEVKRSDGATATAETRVPFVSAGASFRLDPAEITADSTVTQNVYFSGIPSPWNIESIYLMVNETILGGALQGRFFVPYGRTGERTEDGGWRFQLRISEDQLSVRNEIEAYRRQGVYDNSPLRLRSMGIQIRILDEQWDPPEGVFDPEVLAQPGTLSNVENGYGFWGAVGIYAQEWDISLDFSMLLGYKGVG